MKIHIVQKGDTLWEIAQKYGVDFQELQDVNSHISSPDMIMPGMKVKIPSNSKEVQNKDANKETKEQMKEQQKPVSPKPLAVEEDDHKKTKEVKQDIPKPMPQMPSTPPMMQLPTMEQEMNQYTTINVQKEKKESKEKPVKEKEIKSKPEMPQQQGHYYPVQMIPMCCCHMMPPCCCQHHGHKPMMHHMGKGHCHGSHPMAKNDHMQNMHMTGAPSDVQPLPTMPKQTKYEGHKDGMYTYPTSNKMSHQMMGQQHHPNMQQMSQPYPPFYRSEPEVPLNPSPPDFSPMSAHGMGERDPNQ